jgi:FkbM family methyltransferase
LIDLVSRTDKVFQVGNRVYTGRALPQFLKNLLYALRSIWHNDSNRGERGKRILMFVGWQLWKRVIHLPIVVATDNGFRIIARPDSDVAAAFIYYRIPETRDIQFVRSHLNGGVLIDVGANVGSFSILVADKIDAAILFEPNPAAAAQARDNLAINRLPFEVHELAVSDVNGTVEFEDAGGASSTNRTVVGFETKVPTRTVGRVTLDEFLQERGITSEIAAVKIDVEGHENAVIRGMQQLLRDKRARLVMFEYLQRTNLSQALSAFQVAGYKTFELTADGPSEVRGSARPLQNLFACPEEVFQSMLKSTIFG